MTKRRGKRRSRHSRREHPADRKPTQPRERDPKLELALQRAGRWIERDRYWKALDLLEPWVEEAPRDPDVHYLLGLAHAALGHAWDGITALEDARRFGGDPEYFLVLMGLYADLNLPAHALDVWREIDERRLAIPHADEVRDLVEEMRGVMQRTAERLALPLKQVERGYYDMGEARRAIAEGDLRKAITLNRRAVSRLGDWPAPRNNLALALFYAGRVDEAVAEVRRVLDTHPHNLQALSNGVRFLAWSGSEDDARALWAELKDVVPSTPNDYFKKAEAAAVLRDHEGVYETLSALEEGGVEGAPAGLSARGHYFLAVAEANTGRRDQAMRRLEALSDPPPGAADTLAALRAGERGTGWLDYFSYFNVGELIPGWEIGGLFEALDSEGIEAFEAEVRRLAQRFPHMVRVGEKLIWEEQVPLAGIPLLRAIDTPEAYAALRRFGTSQAGDDEARLEALAALVDAGEIAEGDTVRVWLEGKWREIELNAAEYLREAVEGSGYAPDVMKALVRASVTQERGDEEEAEELLWHVLELDPGVKEAYNNLAVIYSKRGEADQAMRMLRQALEIDPLYAMPACNLAHHLLDVERAEEADELLVPLEPVADAGLLSFREEIFFYYTQARVEAYQRRFDLAREYLQRALDIDPDYGPALEMLERLDNMEAFFAGERERGLAWRRRLQEKLDTLEPTLSQTLPLYTKASLKETGWEVMPWGGWSTLRKGELVEALVENLLDEENLAGLVEELTEEERDALRAVLQEGGAMVWDRFEERFDSDLEEPRYWEYHTPQTVMGQLRMRGLLAEATVDGELYILVPADLREPLEQVLS